MWSSRLFFFLAVAFLIYTVAGGYVPQWKQVLT